MVIVIVIVIVVDSSEFHEGSSQPELNRPDHIAQSPSAVDVVVTSEGTSTGTVESSAVDSDRGGGSRI